MDRMYSGDNAKIDETVISLEYLMSRFAVQPALWVAQAVVHQLEKLSLQPEKYRSEPYARLLMIWDAIASQLEQDEATDSVQYRELNLHAMDIWIVQNEGLAVVY